jgi:hypothetical protein
VLSQSNGKSALKKASFTTLARQFFHCRSFPLWFDSICHTIPGRVALKVVLLKNFVGSPKHTMMYLHSLSSHQMASVHLAGCVGSHILNGEKSADLPIEQ